MVDEKEYLKAIGIYLPPATVREVAALFTAEQSKYQAYRVRGEQRGIVAKATASKLYKLWKEGKLSQFESEPPPSAKLPQGIPPQETPALTVRTEAQASVDKDDSPANEVTAQRNLNTEPGGTSPAWFKKRFGEIQDAYSAALDQRMQEALNIQAPSRPQQSPDLLTLNVVSHKLSTSKDQFGAYHLSLTPSVEVNASQYVEVSACVLIMGSKSITEYPTRRRELLGEDTWCPYFSVPEWVRPGTYKACVGAQLEGRYGKVVKSNEFEVSIPILPKVDAAKVEAKKRKLFDVSR